MVYGPIKYCFLQGNANECPRLLENTDIFIPNGISKIIELKTKNLVSMKIDILLFTLILKASVSNDKIHWCLTSICIESSIDHNSNN